MKPILGIDVGGTKIATGLVDGRGRVSNVRIVHTSQVNLKEQLLDLINFYQGFSAIGLGMPGPVLPNGTVTRLPNVKGFKKTNLKIFLQKKIRKPVTVANDANCFALAEAIRGQGRKYKIVAGVILGTGVGVGIIFNKKMHIGKNGVAGEYEHFPMIDGKLFWQHKKSDGPFKDALAAKKYLQLLFHYIVLSVDPEIIILGGGWSTLKGMARLAPEFAKNAGRYQTSTPIKISKIKHAGIVGAALLTRQK